MSDYKVEDDPHIDKFVTALEEAARATGVSQSSFIEPAPGTLARALSNRRHFIFGRRGSGKTSLLLKARTEMLAMRRPNAYIDMEKFKGHAYPDVLISVLIETFQSVTDWLAGGATAPSTKTGLWQRLRIRPMKAPLGRKEASRLSGELKKYIDELNRLLHSSDNAEIETLTKAERATEGSGQSELGLQFPKARASRKSSTSSRRATSREERESLRRSKTDFLHRRIIDYQKTLKRVVDLAADNGFILFDDLYYIRQASQADVLDYFHRLFKGTGLWLKVGTIRHRCSWYKHGDPPVGVKLGDDIEEIDLDLTLAKYRTAKKFLIQVVDSVALQHGVDIRKLLNEGARDRLVLASGGVARDFLSILRRSIAIAREQSSKNVGVEVVNQAAGEYESSKRDEFRRDVEDQQAELEREFELVREFCLEQNKKNCFLVEKDSTDEKYERIKELVDLRLVHAIAPRITVRHRPGRIYEAYMVDLSQYAGERKRRNVDIVEFWKKDGEEKLRGASLIYIQRDVVR